MSSNILHTLVAGLMLGGVALSLGCSTTVATDIALSPTQYAENTMSQGIEGQVSKLSGDFMPRPVEELDDQGSTLPGVQTAVWVFSDKIAAREYNPRWATAEDSREHPQLLQVIETDADGAFELALEPGVYTLFAQHDGVLYLNSFDGEGYYGAVEVISGKVNRVELVNTEDATF